MNRYDELTYLNKNRVDVFINSLASGNDAVEAFNFAFCLQFTFTIVASGNIEIEDYQDKIKAGDNLYNIPQDEIQYFCLPHEAYEAGQRVLNGLDGGKAYNLALKSAHINVKPVQLPTSVWI